MENFNELSLSPPILRAISDLGFEKPSPIQAQTLPILLGEPTDFLGLAATGTGKTAAFAIPLLERIDADERGIQGLILCPTRELAMQVAGQIELLGKHKGIRALAIYGGAPYAEQISGLRRGVHVVVGTPGRLCDHMDRGTLNFDSLHTVILDEADEMISMGFKEDLEKILGGTPKDQRNIWLFSATMSPGVRRVADDYLRDPQQVQVNRTEMLSETVQQIYYLTQESNKPEVLCKLIDAADDFYGLIFFQTKALVVDGLAYLRDRGYKADCLHGDMDQTARERTMKSFRDKKVNILLCTDVASRGLDVKDITHVINYSIPRELDSYVHRIGRTARSGKAGLALSVVTSSHRVLIGRIEKMTESRMTEGRIPTRKEIGAKKVTRILSTLQAQEGHTKAIEILDDSWKTALASMTSEEVAGRFLSLMYPEIFANNTREELAPQRDDQDGPRGRPRYEERAPSRYGDRDSRGGAGYGRGRPPAGRGSERGAGYGERGAGYGERGAGYGGGYERGAGYARVARPASAGPATGTIARSSSLPVGNGTTGPGLKVKPVSSPVPARAERSAPRDSAPAAEEGQSWYARSKPMRASQAAPSDGPKPYVSGVHDKKRPSASPAPWSWKAKEKSGKTAAPAKPRAAAAPRPHFKERQVKVKAKASAKEQD